MRVDYFRYDLCKGSQDTEFVMFTGLQQLCNSCLVFVVFIDKH